MRIPFIAGNWKMNITTENSNFPEETYIAALVENKLDNVEVCVFPPFTHLGLLSAMADGQINIGGQDVSKNLSGAHTGDISADCLIDVGASYVLAGHSERRRDHNESDSVVCAKTQASLSVGLNVVVCIGESDAQNKASDTIKVLTKQLDDSIPQGTSADRIVVAYEPVWSIGTGRVPKMEQIEMIHLSLREHLATSRSADFADGVRIVYGGSVKPENAKDILGLANVDGALVGGASLASEDFIAIMNGVK